MMEPVRDTARFRLHVGRSTTLVHALRDELRRCTTARFAVAFVMEPGLEYGDRSARSHSSRTNEIGVVCCTFLAAHGPHRCRARR
jgi:hypothetical protein